MDVKPARMLLERGNRLRIVVGAGEDDPTLVLWLDEGMVMSESIAGWSAGVVEPVCSISSDFLRTYLMNREAIEIMQPKLGGEPTTGWVHGVSIPDGWDVVPGQRAVQLPDGRTFAVIPGRRWTRVSEYLTNGQLTARFFVDEKSGEAREAEGWRKPKRWPMNSSAQEFARAIVELAAAG
jgi:hypothetical protein